MTDGMQEQDPGFAALGGGVEERSPPAPRATETRAVPEGGATRPGAAGDAGATEVALSGPEGGGVSTEVLIRDLLIFQLKLFMDGVKDIVLSPLAILAVLWDLVPSRGGYRGRTFYQVLKIGERYDLWLNLYTPAREARVQGEGLLEAGVHSADSLVGKLEEMARQEAARQKLRADRTGRG